MMSAGLFFDFGLWTFWRLLLLFQPLEALLKCCAFQGVISGGFCPVYPLVPACAQRMGQAVFLRGLHALCLGFQQGFAEIDPAPASGVDALPDDLPYKLDSQTVNVSGQLRFAVYTQPADARP